MAGWDTLRGVSFQHAVAITAALDLVADAEGLTLQIEGDAHIVDLLLTSTNRLRFRRVRGPSLLRGRRASWLGR
jgi:hypothetical protein